jgi:hypothetical protein
MPEISRQCECAWVADETKRELQSDPVRERAGSRRSQFHAVQVIPAVMVDFPNETLAGRHVGIFQLSRKYQIKEQMPARHEQRQDAISRSSLE